MLFGCYIAGITWNCCHVGTCSVYSIQPRTILHFLSKTQCMCFLAVTCHQNFWQNDWDVFHATAVTHRGGTDTEMSQHRRLTLEKKIPHCSCQELNPWHSNHVSGALLLSCLCPQVAFTIYVCVYRVCSNIWGSLTERTAMLSIVPSAGLKLLIVLGDTHWSVAFLCF